MFETILYGTWGLTLFLLAAPWLLIAFTPLIVILGLGGIWTLSWIARSFSKIRVLVADDDEISVASLLASLDYNNNPVELHYVSTGGEALKRLRKTKFDLLILDYMMPDLNGDKVLEAAEQESGHGLATPVIFYTSNERALDELRAKRFRRFLVADTWPKSLSFNSLDQRIGTTLNDVA